ncbi:S-adenosyl-L-methionine-dependent methyltransferase [Xylaria sp. CBS 124048]|nr:S-adenosyl-L-methionine-dependent methyltransferase [Xylaria sp. CBS 124048]
MAATPQTTTTTVSSDGSSSRTRVATPIKVKLNPVEETMLITLWSRAHDAATANPLLGDTYAQATLDRIDTSNLSSALFPRDQRYHNYASIRAREIDTRCRKFLETHADTPITVLHLACGLDHRATRLRPWRGDKVTWIDLDRPEVVSLRRRLALPQDKVKEKEEDQKDPNYRLLGISVADANWAELVPSDRPLLVIAEGLFPYLTREDATALLKNLVDRAPSGMMVLDTVGTVLARFSAMMPMYRGTGVKLLGIDDGSELAAAHPRLKLVDTARFHDLLPGPFASGAPPCLGTLTPLFSLLPSWRTYGQLFQFEF